MKNVWIDTDMGMDDCFAVLYAHNHPDINIVGISLSAGNVSLDQAIDNYTYLKHIFKLPYPAYKGSSSIELISPEDISKIIGKSGLGWIHPPKLPSRVIDNIPTLSSSENIEIIALAPPYNLPEFINKNKSNINKIHMLNGSRNSVNPEFNLQSAPASTSYCLSSGIPITIYTQDLSEKLPLFRLHHTVNYNDAFQNRFIEMLLNWYDGKPLFDPVVPIALTNPSSFKINSSQIQVSKRKGFFEEGKIPVDIVDLADNKNIYKEFSQYVTKGRNYEGITIISPHLDDAILSLGGTIIKYANTPIHVQNVFSQSRYLKSGHVDKEEASNIRLLEEKSIQKDLPITINFLGFEDWTIRGYSEWNSKVSESQKYLSEVFSKIQNNSNENYRILLPLGIGQCVDHQILCDYRVKDSLYYEDLPYAAYPELAKFTNNMQPHPIKISRFIDKKRELMKKYESQISKKEIDLIETYCINKNGESYETLWG